MTEIHGEDGELIDRLMSVVGLDPPQYPNWWAVAGRIVALQIGGRGAYVSPDTGEVPSASMAAQLRTSDRPVVGREAYCELVRQRLHELVDDDVSEDFLVRAIRDVIDSYIRLVTDTGATDQNRAERSTELLEDLEDIDFIEELPHQQSDEDTNASHMGPGEMADMLRRMAAAGYLNPTTPEEAVGEWSLLETWETGRARISDDVIDRWHSAWLLRR